MTTAPDQPILHFEREPLTEVVCGVQFSPIERFSASHFGQLWERFKPDGYVNCKDAHPLFPVIEQIANSEPFKRDPESVPESLLPRVWFEHSEGTGIIQVQRDRFLHNWRKPRPEHRYPHYYQVKQLFAEHYKKFVGFLVENRLGAIRPLQYEMTYVNQIPKGDAWHGLEDIGAIFPDFVWTKGDRFLPAPSGNNLRLSFDFPERRSRLHATVRDGLRSTDQTPVLLFELTVRGMSADESEAAMWNWFDLAREQIVHAFEDLTDTNIQKMLWRKT